MCRRCNVKCYVAPRGFVPWGKGGEGAKQNCLLIICLPAPHPGISSFLHQTTAVDTDRIFSSTQLLLKVHAHIAPAGVLYFKITYIVSMSTLQFAYSLAKLVRTPSPCPRYSINVYRGQFTSSRAAPFRNSFHNCRWVIRTTSRPRSKRKEERKIPFAKNL